MAMYFARHHLPTPVHFITFFPIALSETKPSPPFSDANTLERHKSFIVKR